MNCRIFDRTTLNDGTMSSLLGSESRITYTVTDVGRTPSQFSCSGDVVCGWLDSLVSTYTDEDGFRRLN